MHTWMAGMSFSRKVMMRASAWRSQDPGHRCRSADPGPVTHDRPPNTCAWGWWWGGGGGGGGAEGGADTHAHTDDGKALGTRDFPGVKRLLQLPPLGHGAGTHHVHDDGHPDGGRAPDLCVHGGTGQGVLDGGELVGHGEVHNLLQAGEVGAPAEDRGPTRVTALTGDLKRRRQGQQEGG